MQVSRCIGLSGSDREFPVLTCRSGTQRARRLQSRAAILHGCPLLRLHGPAWARRYKQAPSPGSDGACVADQVPGLAPAVPVRAVGAFDRRALDGAVLDRVAWPPAVTAERRIRPWVLQEVPVRGRLIRGRLHRPQWLASPAAYVNHAALIQDRVCHTTPVCTAGTVVPFQTRTGRPAASTVDLVVPTRLSFAEDTPLLGALVLATTGPPAETNHTLVSHGDVASNARTVQGMARARSGQAPAWPLVSGRSVRRGSGVKRDFACTFSGYLPPALIALRSQSRLRLEGRARTLSGPSPDLSPARTLAPSARCGRDPEHAPLHITALARRL